jgi:hypothetical protein
MSVGAGECISETVDLPGCQRSLTTWALHYLAKCGAARTAL